MFRVRMIAQHEDGSDNEGTFAFATSDERTAFIEGAIFTSATGFSIEHTCKLGYDDDQACQACADNIEWRSTERRISQLEAARRVFPHREYPWAR